jgi:hypothetical protein
MAGLRKALGRCTKSRSTCQIRYVLCRCCIVNSSSEIYSLGLQVNLLKQTQSRILGGGGSQSARGFERQDRYRTAKCDTARAGVGSTVYKSHVCERVRGVTWRRLTFRMYEQAQEKGLSTARCAAPCVQRGPKLMGVSCPFCRRENSMRRDYEQAQAVMQVCACAHDCSRAHLFTLARRE